MNNYLPLVFLSLALTASAAEPNAATNGVRKLVCVGRVEPVDGEVEVTAQMSGTLVAVRVKSPLVAEGKLRVRFGFPRGHDIEVKNTPALDWSSPERHTTRVASRI